MKNIVTRILNFLLNFKLLKYLLKRPSWSSNVRIVEWYKIFIASIWVLYLALEIEQFKRFALPIYKFVSNYNFLKDIISGHVASWEVAKDKTYQGKIYHDNKSHYFIDGDVKNSKIIPVICYDTVKKSYQYSKNTSLLPKKFDRA